MFIFLFYFIKLRRIKLHSERLWKTIDEITARKNVSRPTCVISEEGVVKTDSKSIAEALSLHFTRIGCKLRNVLKTKIVHYFTSHTQPAGENPNIKDASAVIFSSFVQLFNQFLQAGSYPDVWKMGKVTAFFKSGNCNDINNYRPITVLPVISKILEKAVHDRYLNEHKLLTS